MVGLIFHLILFLESRSLQKGRIQLIFYSILSILCDSSCVLKLIVYFSCNIINDSYQFTCINTWAYILHLSAEVGEFWPILKLDHNCQFEHKTSF